MAVQPGSFPRGRLGGLILLRPCAAQFLDVADSPIVNVALPQPGSAKRRT